jgi:hypothetical protein
MRINSWSSVLRSQGAKGVVNVAREFFANIKIQYFVTRNENKFQKRLDIERNKKYLFLPKFKDFNVFMVPEDLFTY